MNYKVLENCLFWGLGILVFLALVFSEWRSINYYLCGSRSASPVDLIFFSGSVFFLVMLASANGVNFLLKQFFSLWHFLLPIALMVFFYTDRSALSNVVPSFSLHLLLGLSVYMLLSSLVLARYHEEKILVYLMGYILIVTVFFLFVYVFTRFFPLKPFMYSMGTPSLNFPFGSPNQAALFVTLNLILGVGVLLALRKFYFLYLIVPVMVLAVFQTGSRSLAMLLAMGGAAFILLILFQWIYSKTCPWRELVNFLLSVALATTALFLTMDVRSKRSFSIFSLNPIAIATGKTDHYRNNMNKLWSSGAGIKGDITGGEVEKKAITPCGEKKLRWWECQGGTPVFWPKAIAPSLVEPKAVAPSVAEPNAIAPRVAEPKAIAPRVAEPKAIAPSVAEPKAIAPSVAEPKAIAPSLVEPKAVAPSVAEPKAVASSVEEPGAVLSGGAHNAYLDLWLNWGKLSFVSFSIFLLSMLFSTMRLLWHKKTAASYPLYGSLLIGLVVIIGAIYANPLLHLKFVWVFFGLIISFWLKKDRNLNAVR